jgi:hypothetical protein
MTGRRWARVLGDACIYSGPCLLHAVIFWPDVATDYVDIYDGRDATAGKKFCRLEADVDKTRHLGLGQGVPFDVGIYIDGADTAVETTVVFTPLEK